MTLVKNTLQKLDVPFKVRVHSTKEEHTSEDELAHVGYDDIHFHFNYSRYIFFGGAIDLHSKRVSIKLYLKKELLSPSASLEQQKATLAHEAIHIINLHSANRFLFNLYSKKIKKLNKDIHEKCNKIISTIHEYQADILTLTDSEWAKAQLYVHSYYVENNITHPDIYIGPNKMCVLASRAIALHDEEKKIKMGFYDVNSPNFMSEALRTTAEEK